MSINKKLAEIQKSLKAPKNQYNNFGKYNYRSCEDILEGLKPHLGDCSVTITDSIEVHGDRVYVKATVTITDGENSHSVSAYAREPLSKKGMDDSQITGCASSYARKYALNGLFLIDDTKDADSHDNSGIQAYSEIEQQWVDAINAGTHTLEMIEDKGIKNKVAKALMG